MGQFCSTTQAAMTPSETFHLKWNDFHENMATSFKDLRQDGDFTDVTLACEGNQQLQAHKVILSSSSPFFKNVLQSFKSAEPLIYFRHVSHQDLTSVMDFMYYGEADIQQENLNSFLALAEEFELKGLTKHDNIENFDQIKRSTNKTEIEINKETSSCVKKAVKDKVNKYKTMKEVKTNKTHQEHFDSRQPQETKVYHNLENVLEDAEVSNNANITIEELELKVESMVQKQDSKWCCIVCGKQSSGKAESKRHAEVHIEGVQHPCTSCGKTYRSRNSLSNHKSTSLCNKTLITN